MSSTPHGRPRLAADIGGTFTDVVLEADGRLFSAKVLTTHAAPADAVLDGTRRVLAEANIPLAEVGSFIHGTTLAANAIIERRGAKTALLVTEGHRDALETGYENRFDQYDLRLNRPAPLVPRRLRLAVAERMSAEGEVLKPLDETSLQPVIETLRSQAVESIAVGLLHSYANPRHELRIAELLQQALPDTWVSLSSQVSPQIREYDRLSTTAANAYVQPLMAGYLEDLREQLLAEGLDCPLLMVMSTGGLTTVETAVRFPVRLVESGPAGGAILAGEIARRSGFARVVAFDMGGTTAKLCLIEDGSPQYSDSFEVDRVHRFVKGSGLPLRIPAIEMVEIGTGGGSIAWMDELGRLRMGPASAGSDPGPACYGRGGVDATVTDADLLLGRLAAEGFAGGLFDLQPERAQQAVRDGIGKELGGSLLATAAAMTEIADEAMANAARVHAIESGKEVSDRTLIAFGGAAPLHAARVAEKLGVERVVIPAGAGVGSAVGFLFAPVSFELTHTWLTDIDLLTPHSLATAIQSLYGPASQTVSDCAPGQPLTVQLTARMRYAAQSHEIEADIDPDPLGGPAEFRKAFESRYLTLYGRLIPDVPVHLVSLTLRVTAQQPLIAQKHERGPEPVQAVPSKTRAVAGLSTDSVPMLPVYQRDTLRAGSYFDGPAVVVEKQTTTLIASHMRANLDQWGNLIMTRMS